MNDSHGLTASQSEGMSATERAIREKGLTAPRVTPADIENAIASVHFINAGEAAMHNNGGPTVVAPPALSLLTLAVVEMRNGFTVVGKSACASPENFNRELGERIALDDAKRQMWPLLGYALREQLYDFALRNTQSVPT